jgi:hypothetical protein
MAEVWEQAQQSGVPLSSLLPAVNGDCCTLG